MRHLPATTPDVGAKSSRRLPAGRHGVRAAINESAGARRISRTSPRASGGRARRSSRERRPVGSEDSLVDDAIVAVGDRRPERGLLVRHRVSVRITRWLGWHWWQIVGDDEPGRHRCDVDVGARHHAGRRVDGWRCAVPACSSRRNLHDHHIVFFAPRRPHARQPRHPLCPHHLRDSCWPGGCGVAHRMPALGARNPARRTAAREPGPRALRRGDAMI